MAKAKRSRSGDPEVIDLVCCLLLLRIVCSLLPPYYGLFFGTLIVAA